MKLGRWSTTAASNNSTAPDGFPEGMPASSFNDAMREMAASVRTVFSDLQFFDQDQTPTYASASSFTLSGDQTSAMHAGRRLKLFDVSTIYATVTTASFTAVTTINISADNAGVLTSAVSAVALGVSNRSIPRNFSLSAAVAAANTSKAWVRFTASFGGAVVIASYNVSSVSASFSGGGTTARITFTDAFTDTAYAAVVHDLRRGAATITWPILGTKLANSIEINFEEVIIIGSTYLRQNANAILAYAEFYR